MHSNSHYKVCALLFAEDYELALEMDKVQEQALLRRGHKAEALSVSAEVGTATAVDLSQLQSVSPAGLLQRAPW